MIVCTFIGGPRDGDKIALPDITWFRVPVPINVRQFTWDPEALPEMQYTYVEMFPELTPRGWVLRWHEPERS